MNNKFATYLCCLVIVVFGISLTIVSPLLTAIAGTYSLSIAQVGVIFVTNFLGFVTFVLAGGVLADRWGKIKVFSIALAGLSVSLLLLPLSPNFLTLCIIFIFIGGFGGTIETLCSALVTDLNPDKPSFYVNLTQIFFGIGALLGPIAAGFAISSGISWKQCYLILGCISLVLTLVFVFSKIPNKTGSDSITWTGFVQLVNNWKFLLVCLCMFLYTGSEVGAWGWMCTFLEKSLNFTVAKSSIAIAVFWLALTLGRIVCGPLTSRFKLQHIIVALALLSSIVTALSAFIGNETVLWVVIALMGLAYSSQFPFIASYGSTVTRAPSGTVFSLLIGSGGVGSMFIPYLMGVTGNSFGMNISMLLPAVFFFCIVLILLFLGSSKPSKAESAL